MKTQTVLIISMLLLAACSGGKADYAKTVSDHLTSKAPAGYTVEILDLETLAPVTVADSIAILQAEFEDDREGKADHLRGVLDLARMLPEGPDRQNREQALQRTIDSLAGLVVPEFYGDVSPDKVLAVPVRCRYSVSAAGTSQSVTETFDFWLAPDADEVLYQRKAR